MSLEEVLQRFWDNYRIDPKSYEIKDGRIQAIHKKEQQGAAEVEQQEYATKDIETNSSG